jgi:hypothetical protein
MLQLICSDVSPKGKPPSVLDEFPHIGALVAEVQSVEKKDIKGVALFHGCKQFCFWGGIFFKLDIEGMELCWIQFEEVYLRSPIIGFGCGPASRFASSRFATASAAAAGCGGPASIASRCAGVGVGVGGSSASRSDFVGGSVVVTASSDSRSPDENSSKWMLSPDFVTS